MAYDCDVAICNSLHYGLIMSPQVCVQLVTAACVCGVPVVMGQIRQISSLPFCGSTTINYFFLWPPPSIQACCGDTFVNEIAVYAVSVVFIMVSFLLTMVKSSPKFWNHHPPERGLKPSPLARLTSQWWSYSTAQPLPSIYNPNQIDLKKLGSWSLFSTQFGTQHWIIHTMRNKYITVALRKLISKLSTWLTELTEAIICFYVSHVNTSENIYFISMFL